MTLNMQHATRTCSMLSFCEFLQVRELCISSRGVQNLTIRAPTFSFRPSRPSIALAQKKSVGAMPPIETAGMQTVSDCHQTHCVCHHRNVQSDARELDDNS